MSIFALLYVINLSLSQIMMCILRWCCKCLENFRLLEHAYIGSHPLLDGGYHGNQLCRILFCSKWKWEANRILNFHLKKGSGLVPDTLLRNSGMTFSQTHTHPWGNLWHILHSSLVQWASYPLLVSMQAEQNSQIIHVGSKFNKCSLALCIILLCLETWVLVSYPRNSK